ncbi:MAG TPA: nucleoside hydrolase, partial [Stackebrandtia sp.]|uniref:nucleoside hydrolase n=1 Tax=Stackebrandtia sp. TaxID=2023065 RepID=UPI002D4075F6
MPTDVILDVDTGVDDALALLFAARHPGLRLRAVTCVDGNVGVDRVVRNTLAVLETAGRSEVPVARGAERPLLSPVLDARGVHGAGGLGGVEVPEPSTRAVPGNAVELLRRTIMETPGEVTVIALAPLTNLALLFRTHPETAAAVKHVMFMGGSIGAGNTTAGAEFNIWHDPEAAGIVLDSGAALTMYGLDVFYQVTVDDTGIKRLSEGDAASRLAAGLLNGRVGSWRQESRIADPGAACVGDAGAVCAVADPAGLQTRRTDVHVSLAPGPTRGMTLADMRTSPQGRPMGETDPLGTWPAEVAVAVDGSRYR